MAVPILPYYSGRGASAQHYDRLAEADRNIVGDLAIYAGLAEPPARVLELGAGTGRVAIDLAQRGFHVVGLDISAPMLAQAEVKQASLEPEVAARLRFVRGDMAALALNETFDLVLATYYALAHLPAGTAWRNTFKGVADHLVPGGLAAFHMPLSLKMEAAPPRPDQAVHRETIGGGRQLLLYVADRKFNPKLGRMDLLLDFVTLSASGGMEARTRERLTYYTADLNPYARAVGLEPQDEPIPMGETGAIHLFRKA
jgi:SAM-dependent methyltransferase